MGTLLEFIEAQEKSHSRLGVRNLHKLKQVYGTGISQQDFEFQLKAVLKLIDSAKPKSLSVNVDPEYTKISKLEFKPTISRPNFVFRDRFDKPFSGWYTPTVYVPQTNSVTSLNPDFLFFRGDLDCMYRIEPEFRRELYSYEFLSDQMLRKLSMKLLSRMHPVHLAVFARRRFYDRGLAEIKAVQFYLRPRTMLVLSESELSTMFKMGLPVNTRFIEKVDMNYEKIKQEKLFY